MPEEINPTAGGSWLRDPVTGELSPNAPPGDQLAALPIESETATTTPASSSVAGTQEK